MERFLIATASGRALASSARNAGYRVDVFDLFGDWDLQKSVSESSETALQSTAGCVFTGRDFSELFRQVDLKDYRAVLIGGGLEAKPKLLQRLEQQLPILGCQPRQLNRLLSYDCLEVMPRLVAQSGARWPMTRTTTPDNLETSWRLLKSLRGSGGKHVSYWSSNEAVDEKSLVKSSSVFQQGIFGASVSALFVAQTPSPNQPANHSGSNQNLIVDCQLIGCSLQLVGEAEFGASPFSYCGSIAPFVLPENERNIVERLGSAIAAEFEIFGVFGLDLILNQQGVWLIDVNPRIPASAELYERLSPIGVEKSISIFKSHMHACLGNKNSQPFPTFSRDRWVAKGILFCKPADGLVIGKETFEQLKRLYYASDSPMGQKIADVPKLGTQIAKGDPILTFFSEACSPGAAQDELTVFAEQLNNLLANHSIPALPG